MNQKCANYIALHFTQCQTLKKIGNKINSRVKDHHLDCKSCELGDILTCMFEPAYKNSWNLLKSYHKTKHSDTF